MKLWLKNWLPLLAVALLLSGCSQNMKSKQAQLVSVREEVFIPIMEFHQQKYISIQRLANMLHFNNMWDGDTNTFWMGARDVEYEVQVHSNQAIKEGKVIMLKSTPIMENGMMYVPLSSVQTLFGSEMNFTVTPERIVMYPSVVMKSNE